MSDPLDTLQLLVARRGTKAQITAESGGTLEEQRLAYATDTSELGIYTGGAWVWIGATALTVKDEGTPLTTAATALDFVGAGVVASGTGATKTITIAGGGAPSGAAGGQLSGTYPNPLVAVHDEPLTDGASNFIFDGGDVIVVTGVPN